MAKSFGVNFLLGAQLQSSVGSAFASLGGKMQALRQSFRNSERQSAALGGLIVKQRELADAIKRAKAQAQAGGEVDKKLADSIGRLAAQYGKAARQAGVYGQSLDQIAWKQRESARQAQAAENKLRSMQMIQAGRDLRQSGRDQRASVYGAFAQTQSTLGQIAQPLKTGMEFEASMSQVKAISRAGKEDLAKMEAQARQLGATTVWSAKEAAEGMTYLSMAGFKTNETMQAMPGMLSLASAGGIGLGQTADIASNILTGFGLKAADMDKVGDILAKTFTSSNTTLTGLGETFKYAAPAAAKAKQSFEDTAAMIAMLGNAGVQGSMAGTALNAMMLRMASPPKMAAEAMRAVGVSMADANGNMRAMPDFLRELGFKLSQLGEVEQIDLARKIFGLENAKSGLILMEQAMSGELQNFSKNVYEKGFSGKVAKDQIDNLSGDLKSLNSAWQETSIALYQTLAPALRKITQGLTEIIRPIGEWISANPRLVQGIVVIGGALVGLKVAGMAFAFLNSYRSSFAGGVMSMRGQVSGALSSVGGAFGRLRSELNKPVSLSTQGVTQGVASMKSKFESLRQSLGQTMATLRNFKPSAMAAGAAAAASGTVAAAGRAGFNSLRIGVKGVGMAFKTMFGPMSLLIMGLSLGVDWIMENWSKIQPFFESLWEGVKACFETVMGWLQPIFDKIMSFIGPMINGVSKAMEAVGKAWDWLFGNDKKETKVAEAAVEPQAAQAAVKTPEQIAQEEKWAQEGLGGKRDADAKAARYEADKAARKAEAERKRAKKEGRAPNQDILDAEKEAKAKAAQASSAKWDALLAKHAASPEDYGDDYGAMLTDFGEPEAPKPAPKAAKKKAGKKGGGQKQASQAAAEPQLVQPQVQVALNVTQNGIPEQTFAQGVMNAIKARQAELEQMISALVHEQARVAYGS